MDVFGGNAQDANRFLTVAETAEILKVSPTDVYRLIDSGELHAFRVGSNGPWRIEHDILELFVHHQYELTRRAALWSNAEHATAHNVIDL